MPNKMNPKTPTSRYIIIKITKFKTNKKKEFWGVPIVAQHATNLSNIHEDVNFIPGLAQWVKDLALV